MGELRFVHAADLHLGRLFSGLERTTPELGRIFRRAHSESWERIVREAVARKVDFVTLAGDVFDASNPGVRARVDYRDGVNRLHEAGIPVFVVLGNHDPLATFPESLRNLSGQHLFGTEPEGIRPSSVEYTDGVMVFGVSFPKTVVRDNLVNKFRRDPGLDLAIGLVHANVSGMGGHRNYAPCTMDDLRAAGMDVWCLGHVHSRTVLSRNPLVLYPGASQGAHINEPGPHGCDLVTVNHGGMIGTEFLPVAPVRWESVHVDVTGFKSVEDVMDAVEAGSSNLADRDESVRAIVVRFNLVGRGAPEVMRELENRDELSDILSDRLSVLPVPVFPESVRDMTLPWIDLESAMDEDGFLADFLKLCSETADDPVALQHLIEQVQRELLTKVSPGYLSQDLKLRAAAESDCVWRNLLDHARNLTVKAFTDPTTDATE
ncbi:MAG: DNA repair exonuclease [Desulfomonilaceae bacterium]|nr:DNA repair exonuclease [Desulfomonilaceae bacterium]